MPTVDTTVWIAAPLAIVYEIAKDSASYPEYMKDVQSVTPVERSENRLIADYVGLITAFNVKVRWRQEEVWNDATHSSEFRQITGDYDLLEGRWTFAEENGGTRFTQHLDYEYNVPTLGPLVKKVVHSLVVKNLENINAAFKERAEAAAG